MMNIPESARLTVEPVQKWTVLVFAIVKPWRGDTGEHSPLILRAGMQEAR